MMKKKPRFGTPPVLDYMPKRSHDTPKPKQRTPFVIPEFEIVIDDSLGFTVKNKCVGTTHLFGLYGDADVLMDRYGFFGLAVVNRVYNSTRLCLKPGQNLSQTGYAVKPARRPIFESHPRAKWSGGRSPVRKRQESEPSFIRVLHWVLSYTGYDVWSTFVLNTVRIWYLADVVKDLRALWDC